MFTSRVSLASLAIAVSAPALACDTDGDQFVVTGSLAAADGVRVGSVPVHVARAAADPTDRDERSMSTTVAGVFGWPAPIEDAGGDAVYTVVAHVPGAPAAVVFSVPDAAAQAGGYQLPPVPVWHLATTAAAVDQGVDIGWTAPPGDVVAAAYTVDIVGIGGGVAAPLWRETVVDGTELSVPAHLLEDFALDTAVVAHLPAAAPVVAVQVTSSSVQLDSMAEPVVPATRGATCGTDPDVECPFADGQLVTTTADGGLVGIELAQSALLETLVVRGLTASVETSVAVEISADTVTFEQVADATAGDAPAFVELALSGPRLVRAIRLRALGGTDVSLGVGEISGF